MRAILGGGSASGALAGLAGGLVFGAAMTQLGVLPSVASLVRAESAVVGFIVHMLIAAVIGAGFGILVGRQRPGAGETLFWGLSYGAFWWFLGPLTLMPLLLGGSLTWDVPSAQAAFPSLLGHLWYGVSAGLALVLIRLRQGAAVEALSRGALLRGALAGLAGGWLLKVLLDGQDPSVPLTAMATAEPPVWAGLVVLLIGVLAGLGFAILYPRPADGSGPWLVRGSLYGFCWWVVGPLTLVPLFRGFGLTWSLETARAEFASLVGFLLFGAAMALSYQWLDTLARVLFSDVIGGPDEEGVGVQGLRAIGRGVLGGLVGGLLFTVVMVRVGFLPAVASLIGSTSPVTGLVVHLLIAVLVGASYGLLFRRQSFDVGSALGWGVSYGFFWWIFGALTLMPILLGVPPRWTVAVAGGLTASLVGHLAYGAGLGITFHLLEARYSPWWIPVNQAAAVRSARRRDQVLTSAPAVWVMVAVIALTLPVVLGE